MNLFFLVGTLYIALYVQTSKGCAEPAYTVIFGWKQLDYRFQTKQIRDQQLATGEFIPENNIIAGIKVKGDRIFVTVPRSREGVPSTLNYVQYNKESPLAEINEEIPNGPLLVPYPSWEMNQLGNCNALQYVQSMEIDQFGRMWVIDVGRVNTDTKCPPKLVLIDLANDEVVRQYDFPSNVVSPTGNFLNDLVVGCADSSDECYAYISDAADAKLVVYNFKENRSWYVHHSTMVPDPQATLITILGKNYTFTSAINGMALSPRDSNFDRVYYCPLSSYNLYSVPTSVLKSATNGISLEDSQVTHHGRKSSQSGGIGMDAKGILFYGLFNSNAVAYFNISQANLNGSNEAILAQNDIDFQWPDTFAFDEAGYLYVTPNRLQRYNTNTLNFTEINFRIIRIFVGSTSYMYSEPSKVLANRSFHNLRPGAYPGQNFGQKSDYFKQELLSQKIPTID